MVYNQKIISFSHINEDEEVKTVRTDCNII